MKKFILLIFCTLLLVSTYYDLTKGTLPAAKPSYEPTTDIPSNNEEVDENKRYRTKLVEIHYGDTVLGIIEELNDALPVTINQAIEDFLALNNDIDSPENIQQGEIYQFPIYKNSEKSSR